MKNTPAPLIVRNSVTALTDDDANCVFIGASHFGLLSAHLLARHQVRGAILHDAGIGLDDAGIAGLQVLQILRVPAAAVDFRSARIGDADEVLMAGCISHANEEAQALGIRIGFSCWEAAQLMRTASERLILPVHGEAEARHLLPPAHTHGVPVWALDSASLIDRQDCGQIVITGSHGGLLGRDPATAARVDVFAAVFNDAGGGKDDAGYSRLPALDGRNIAAATVAAETARIGSALSTWNDGRVSRVNATAAAHGLREGMMARELTSILCSILAKRS